MRRTALPLFAVLFAASLSGCPIWNDSDTVGAVTCATDGDCPRRAVCGARGVCVPASGGQGVACTRDGDCPARTARPTATMSLASG